MCQLEIKLYQARIDGMKSKSQRYLDLEVKNRYLKPYKQKVKETTQRIAG